MFDIAAHCFTLPDSFIKPYQDKQPHFGPLGYFTFKRTYARQIAGESRTEEYWETCKRVVEGTFSIQKNHCKRNHLPWDERKALRTAKRMFELMWEFKFLPPGRGLWAMGTKYIQERGGAALNNCFSADTKILTDRGVVRIGDVVGQTVKVMDGASQWTDAIINDFGQSVVQDITFRPVGLRSNMRITHTATPDHRWLVESQRGTADTTALQVGDKVRTLTISHLETQPDYADGVIHGLIFGDGTRHTYYHNRFMIRLCDSKTQAYQEVLELHKGYISTTNVGGDPFVTLVDKNQNLKDLPINKSPGYLKGFIDGWLAADSSKTPAGSFVLATIRHDAASWLVDNAPFAGSVVTGWSIDNTETNFGERSAPLNKLTLSCNQHQLWVVESIIVRDIPEHVFCPSVSTTASFTLAHGIHTGNCAFVSTKDLATDPVKPFLFVMDMSMVGVGVGFDTLGANKLKIVKPLAESYVFVVPDSREGWVEALRLLLTAYTVEGNMAPVYDTSLVRVAGEPIRGFGGTSSGPAPLLAMLADIRDVLDAKIGQCLSSTDIVDIGNFIGCCVVAGNVRRSAEIVFGEITDTEFSLLKQDKEKLLHHRWASNNSIFANVGMDYTWHAEQTATNGEPGYMWLDNARAFGRMKDPADWADREAVGGNPCLEQTLHNYELCTLVETFPSRHENLEEYLETLKIAYLYAKTVTLVPTHWQETNAVMCKNRRIGLSQSGIIKAFVRHGRREILRWCDRGYEFINGLDIQYSNWLGVPRSIKKTSVKPSGTISLLPGEPPGIHYPHSEYYIRRIRVGIHSPLLKIASEAGYHVEPAVGQESTTSIVLFPIHEEFFVRAKDDVSIWEQVANAVAYQRFWADNQVSITVTFSKDEKDDIKHVLELYEDTLKGISFLPIEEHGYVQAPYETISREQYLTMTANIDPTVFSRICEGTVAPKFCDGDTCTL